MSFYSLATRWRQREAMRKVLFLYSLKDMCWSNHVCREIFRSWSAFLLSHYREKLLKLQTNSRRYGSLTYSLAFACMVSQSQEEKGHIWFAMSSIWDSVTWKTVQDFQKKYQHENIKELRSCNFDHSFSILTNLTFHSFQDEIHGRQTEHYSDFRSSPFSH